MKLDMHVHYIAGLPSERPVPPELAECASSADAILAKVKEAGADGAVLLARPYAQRELCELQNEMIYRVMNAHPGEVYGFGAVSPSSWGDAAADAASLIEKGFAGIGMLDPTAQNFALTDPQLDAVAAVCAEKGAPMSFYTSFSVGEPYPGKSKILPVQWMEFIAEHQEVKILLAHYGAGLPFYGLMKEVDGKLGNVWFDTAPDRTAFRAGTYGAAAGFLGSEEKLLYGSNLPYCGPADGADAPVRDLPETLAEIFRAAEDRRKAAVAAAASAKAAGQAEGSGEEAAK